jgi:DNA-binding NarL/FixJ family response regulator
MGSGLRLEEGAMTGSGGDRDIRILVADDHSVVRAGLVALLHSWPDLRVVGEAEDGDGAVDLFSQLRPDLTLMDLQMPVRSGLEAIADIRQVDPSAKIIILTTYSGDVQAKQALTAGASGYLLKTALRAELIDAVRTVIAGGTSISAEIASELASHAEDDSLTLREVAILRHLATGASNKVIARSLSITDQTVKWHLKSIFAKLQASDRTDAVLRAGRRGALNL